MTSRLTAARRGPSPSPAPPGGPAGRYLLNPGGYRRAPGPAAAVRPASTTGRSAGPLLAAAVTAVIAGRAWLRRRQHAAFAAAARQVTILAPPQAGPDGAVALWGHLTGLLRPPWARLLSGQPHLGWEYAWAGGDAAGMTHPPVGARHHPARPDRARGRGRLARRAHRHRPGRAAAAGRRRRSPAGRCGWPARTSCPLSTGHDPEAPLRALAGAAARLADGEHAVLQVLARPVTGARLRKARRAARRQRTGQTARLSSRLLDLASPGSRGGSRTRPRPRQDPELAAEVRETTDKLAGPQWETLIRYAVATTAPGQAPRRAGRWERRAAAARRPGAAARPGPRPGVGHRPADRRGTGWPAAGCAAPPP